MVPDVAALAWFQVSVGQPLVPWDMLAASMKLPWPSGTRSSPIMKRSGVYRVQASHPNAGAWAGPGQPQNVSEFQGLGGSGSVLEQCSIPALLRAYPGQLLVSGIAAS